MARMKIGERIKAERQAQGVSRRDLAALSGVKYPTLAGIENGDQDSSTQLHKLAAALGVLPSWLETGKGAKSAASNNVRPTGKEPDLDPALVIARLENDIDAMRFALSALATTMTVFRPVEAAAAAKLLRERAPPNFRHQGFAHELASALEKAAKPETSAPADAPARASRRSSRPK